MAPSFDSTCWDAVIDDLKRLGATAVAVELPLTGFDADVDAVRQAIEAAGPNVVVAAHSYGGCVVSAAASGNPDVTALFYVAAFLTEQNEHPFTILADYHGELLDALVITDTDTGVGVDAARARDVFFGDRDDESAAQLAARLRHAAHRYGDELFGRTCVEVDVLDVRSVHRRSCYSSSGTTMDGRACRRDCRVCDRSLAVLRQTTGIGRAFGLCSPLALRSTSSAIAAVLRLVS
jgi:pimeloyl-ACP methyl ester carboxylesterase